MACAADLLSWIDCIDLLEYRASADRFANDKSACDVDVCLFVGGLPLAGLKDWKDEKDSKDEKDIKDENDIKDANNFYVVKVVNVLNVFFSWKKEDLNFSDLVFHKKKTQSLQIGSWTKSLAATYSPTLLCVVPSAMKGLTSEFGMGSGISPTLLPPSKLYNVRFFP